VTNVRKLVIVESPAKARTIAGYLGTGFEVEASVGHIRDLPAPRDLPAEMKKGPFGKFAVDVDNGFEPYYVVSPDRKSQVTALRRALKEADELYLATDEDREGEAIAWHLLEVLKPRIPVKRMVFHEITRPAIERALAHPRDVNTHLVDAQETRRILDRLYGWEVSPVLWRKIGPGLSAGRVQSVATRMVVERERERIAFIAASFWDVTGTFAHDGDASFQARLTAIDGTRVATGKDFDDSGAVTSQALILDEAAATSLVRALEGQEFSVADLTTKPYRRRPSAPFTTSTYQQEASRKLRLNSREAMRIAQRLYEAGYITYMRTDSVSLSDQAIAAARRQAAELFGADSVPSAPRHYATKSKGAQEAHEAIRPSGEVFKTPAQLAGALSGTDLKVYELIWKRTLASQMSDAIGHTATVKVEARASDGRMATFAASGTVITHRGFLAAYEEGRDAARYDAEEPGSDRLPPVVAGQRLEARALAAEGHETSPPPRFTEASLVAALEKRGIGRPSTYASIMSTIEERGYVLRRAQALIPSWLAFSVVALLEGHFADLVDYDFTAEMESGLDEIAAGTQARQAWLHAFYFGDGKAASARVDDPGHHLKSLGLKRLVLDQGEIDARAVNTIELAERIGVRVGRYGPYLEETTESGDVRRAPIPGSLAPDELTAEVARGLLEEAAKGPDQRELGHDPATGRMIVARDGRFGPYVTEVMTDDGGTGVGAAASAGGGTSSSASKGKGKGKAAAPKARNASLFKTMQIETVSLDEALALLALPRLVGADPASGEEITAQNGRYGPYVKRGSESRSLADEEAILTVTLEEALALLAAPKGRRTAQAASTAKTLGTDPASGRPITLKDGRFGPYVTDGETNATVPRGEDPASVGLERAAQMLADKRARGPVQRRGAGGRKAAPRKK